MHKVIIGSYFRQESLSPIKSSRSTNIEVFMDLILARLGESRHKLMEIFREIKVLGYSGGRTQGCYHIKRILENITEIRVVRKLVQIFKTMLARSCGNIKRWIDFVKHSKYKLAGLKSFARGLMTDIVAVENGIKMSWSIGAVEGYVNRIKSIKRGMYGRASFELLRKKVILSRAG
jgi:hypothetical protein